jgi:hypothetical protein
MRLQARSGNTSRTRRSSSWAISIATAAAVGLLLVGCQSAPSSKAHHSTKASGTDTCNVYLALGKAKRTVIADGFGAGADSIASYTSNGATTESWLDALDAGCRVLRGADPAAVASSLVPATPTCARFLALAAPVQTQWATAYFATHSDLDPGLAVDSNTSALVGSCKYDDSITGLPQDLDIAAHEILSLKLDNPIVYSALTGIPINYNTPLSGYDKLLAWTTSTQSGNPESMVLRFAAPSTSAETPSAFSNFTVGASCPFDPATDVYLAAVFFTTNSSTTKTVVTQSDFRITEDSDDPLTVMADVNFASGPQCIHVNGTGNIEGFSSSSTAPFPQVPVAPGKTSQTNLFFILHNYFSPSYPAGDPAALTGVQLQGVEVTGTSDPDVTISGSPVDLNGEPAGQGG